MSLLSIIQSTFIHDRAKVCISLMNGRINQMETSIIIPAIGSCFIHDRAKLSQQLIQSYPRRFLNFTSNEWSDLLTTCYVHDRSKLLTTILDTLPTQVTKNINEKHIALLWVHDRMQVTMKLFDIQNETIKTNEIKFKQTQTETVKEEEETALKIALEESKKATKVVLSKTNECIQLKKQENLDNVVKKKDVKAEKLNESQDLACTPRPNSNSNFESFQY